MARASRAESQQQTREALIAAAVDHFAAVGYGAASLDRIADNAGFTRGAIYANFDGKAALFLAVLDVRLDQQVQTLERATGDLAALAEWRERNAADQFELSLAVREFKATAMRDPELRGELRARERRVRAAFAGLIESACAEHRITLPVAAADAATVLLALGDGITEQHQLDPDEVSMDLFSLVLERLLRWT